MNMFMPPLAKPMEADYPIVFYIRKAAGAILPISARDMNNAERKYYERQR